MSVNFENISLLVSGCMTYLDCHFVLRLHGPIWLAFSAQVAWTYIITILCSVAWTDIIDIMICIFALRSHGPILHVWTCSTEGLGILSYFCYFALRPHRPTWLPFCAQVAWTYMISILHSGHMDLLYIYSTLKYYNAALCHPHLLFMPTMYTSTIL